MRAGGGGGQLWAGSGELRPSTEKPVPLSHRGHKAHGSRRGVFKGGGASDFVFQSLFISRLVLLVFCWEFKF